MIPIYKHFAKDWNGLDFSDEALEEFYLNESRGLGTVKPNNGYTIGNKWINVVVEMWLEDMFITLLPHELYNDPNLPNWWLDKVISSKIKGKSKYWE